MVAINVCHVILFDDGRHFPLPSLTINLSSTFLPPPFHWASLSHGNLLPNKSRPYRYLIRLMPSLRSYFNA